jgi:hypothetical protein
LSGPSIRDITTFTTTQLNNRGGGSGCFKRKSELRVDGRCGGEAREEVGRGDLERRGNLKND